MCYKIRMKNRLLTSIITILLLTGAVSAQPELEIVNNEFDFGFVPQNSTVSQCFWFKSIGTDTLVINEIKTGCTCVLIPLEKEELAPGDSMRVGIIWNLGHRLYNVGRYPYIYTNASPEPYRIYLTGEAHKTLDSTKPISIKPYKLELAQFQENSINKIEFKLTNRSKNDITIQMVTENPEECEFSYPSTIKANSSAKGYIKVKKEYLDKEFKGSVTFAADDNNNTRFTIPYRRKIY